MSSLLETARALDFSFVLHSIRNYVAVYVQTKVKIDGVYVLFFFQEKKKKKITKKKANTLSATNGTKDEGEKT